jgi:16S rRNA (guanine(966)-N(2))-methyltransferase RsmD
MRVIAGKFRSRNLQSLPGVDTRPTYDRLKETLFNVLAAAGHLEGKIFVDLFAGTGSIGIEALSRGASRVYFAESAKKAVQVIRGNLLSLGVDHEAEVYEQSSTNAIRQLAAEDVLADVIFLDPPYKMQGAYSQVLRIVSETGLLSTSGVLVAEHEKRFDPGHGEGTLRRFRTLHHGESALSFYRVTNAKSDDAC